MTAARLSLAWCFVCAVASTAWIATAASRLGVTFDEPVYVTAGLDRWRHGGIGGLMRLGTMPLAVDVVTLPVWAAERWRGEPYRLASDDRGRVVDARDLGRALPLARAGTLVFWWILLASAWRLATALAGPAGGALAATWLSAEPSLIAHAALATTDIAVTAMLVGLAASLYGPDDQRAATGPLRAPPRSRWLIPGVWFGLAILAKASAIVFAPLIGLAFALGRGDTDWRSYARRWLRISVVACAVTVVYCGSDWRTEDSFVAWARSLPPGPAATLLVAIAEHLPIFSNAGEGVVQQIKHNVRGHDAYVLGESYPRSVWFYFPVVLVIKTSGTFLVGLAATLAIARHALLTPPLVAALLMLLLSPLFRVQTGIRMILPIVALATIGLAVAFATTMATGSRRRAAAARVVVGLLAAWSYASAGRSWPDAITFVNDLWGGAARAPYLVSDSNYDWGQGLPVLRARLAGASDPIDLWYWGSDPDAQLGPFRVFDVRAEAPADAETLRARLSGRTLAVSATLLDGSVFSPASRGADEDRAAVATAAALRRLLRAHPNPERVGTFWIYRF
jgi:hypothetical protein